MESIITLKNITKVYDDKTVVNNINLDVKKGEFVTFLGPSGCGKTTTLRMIAGFEKPTEGEVLFNGENIADVPPYKRNINTVFQRYALFPHLNVFNNVAFGIKLKQVPIEVEKTVKKQGQKQVVKVVKLVNLKNMPVEQHYIAKDGSEQVKPVKFKQQFEYVYITAKNGERKRRKQNCYKKYIEDKVHRALKIVGLSDYEQRDVTSLSGGQQQRVAIARAIINEPQVLLLDEPLGALDLKMRQEMQLELKQMHKKLGITFIYVTHDQEEALTMSDTIIVMRDGIVCQEGVPMDIYNEPKNAFVADFIGESNIFDGIMIADKKVTFCGSEFKCVDAGFEHNQPVDVVIRPEDFELRPYGECQISGEITSVIFKGVHYEMTLKSNGFEYLIHNTKECKVGDKISLYIAPFDIHIMEKESYNNTATVVFKGNNKIEMCSSVYEFEPSALIAGAEYDEENDVLTLNGEQLELDGKSAVVSFEFADVDLTDNEEDAPLAGNIYSMIYKGKNYLVTVKTDNGTVFMADTEYLWDDGDRVGLAVAKDKFRLVRFVEDEEN